MTSSLKVCSLLSHDLNHQTSKLIYKALPTFYDLLPVSEDERANLIESQLSSESTELSNTKAFIKKDKILGVFTAFPSKQLKALQMGSAINFLKNLPPDSKNDYLKDLKKYSTKVGEAPENSYYLSRISVAEKEMGADLASSLLEQFFLDGKGFDLFGLHVHKENHRAIRFFQKSGFKRSESPGEEFNIMIRQT